MEYPGAQITMLQRVFFWCWFRQVHPPPFDHLTQFKDCWKLKHKDTRIESTLQGEESFYYCPGLKYIFMMTILVNGRVTLYHCAMVYNICSIWLNNLLRHRKRRTAVRYRQMLFFCNHPASQFAIRSLTDGWADELWLLW